MSAYDHYEKKKELERAKWEKVRNIARQQGLMLVQVSPRRYQVVQCSSSVGVYWINSSYHTYLSGEVVFGPATFSECREYLRENTTPLAEELVKS